MSTRINRIETVFLCPSFLLFVLCLLSRSSWNLCSNRSWSNYYYYYYYYVGMGYPNCRTTRWCLEAFASAGRCTDGQRFIASVWWVNDCVRVALLSKIIEQPVGKMCHFWAKTGVLYTTTQPCEFELFSLKSAGHSPAPGIFFGGVLK